MRNVTFIVFILSSITSCSEKDKLDLRENLIGKWSYTLATTQIYFNGEDDTYYSEGWIRLDRNGSGEESTPFSIERTITWKYDNDAQEITITPTTIISVNDIPVTYEIRRNEPHIQEWYNESTLNSDKIIYTWSLTKK